MNSQLLGKNTIFAYNFFFLNSKARRKKIIPQWLSRLKSHYEKELKKFIRFNYELYKIIPIPFPICTMTCWIPSIPRRIRHLNSARQNISWHTKAREIVGRVAAIINHRANDTWNKKEVRFGWLDFIDEEEVSSALLESRRTMGKEKGMEAICRSVGIYGYGCRRNAGWRIRPVEYDSHHL